MTETFDVQTAAVLGCGTIGASWAARTITLARTDPPRLFCADSAVEPLRHRNPAIRRQGCSGRSKRWPGQALAGSKMYL